MPACKGNVQVTAVAAISCEAARLCLGVDCLDDVPMLEPGQGGRSYVSRLSAAVEFVRPGSPCSLSERCGSRGYPLQCMVTQRGSPQLVCNPGYSLPLHCVQCHRFCYYNYATLHSNVSWEAFVRK